MMQAIRTQKIAEVIALHIERLILQGALRPGEKLASERELALKFDVSRPSLRDAIEKLAARGLLTATRSGTYVAQFLTPIMEPLASLYRDNQNAAADYFEFRQWVEAQAARSAAVRATDVDKAAIRACLAQMRKAHKISDPSQEAQADVNLHILFYEASHNLIVLPCHARVKRASSQQHLFSIVRTFTCAPGCARSFSCSTSRSVRPCLQETPIRPKQLLPIIFVSCLALSKKSNEIAND